MELLLASCVHRPEYIKFTCELGKEREVRSGAKEFKWVEKRVIVTCQRSRSSGLLLPSNLLQNDGRTEAFVILDAQLGIGPYLKK